MGILLSTRRAAMGAPNYVDKVLSYSPIAYWPLDETAGAVAACKVNAAQNGTAVGVTWANALGPDGVNGAPFFDGANDYIDIFSATLSAAFNGATGSMMIWCRVANAGVWTDATARLSSNIQVNAANRYAMRKWSANNTLRATLIAGGGTADIDETPYSSTDWFCHAITWSDQNNDDEAKAFLDGAQVGITSAALTVWAGGALAATSTCIGAYSTTPANVWHGWLAHGAVWDTVLTPAEIAILANPAP